MNYKFRKNKNIARERAKVVVETTKLKERRMQDFKSHVLEEARRGSNPSKEKENEIYF